jgi:hypothetical protein
VRSMSIHAFPDPFLNPNRKPEFPGAVVDLNYEAEEAVVIARELCRNSGNNKVREPITVLLRCSDEGFNTIRQYDFLPKRYTPDSTPDEHVQDDGERVGHLNTRSHLPFRCPSVCTRVIPVAPSCSRLQFGTSGKGIWFETRNIPVGITNSLKPARCLIGVDVSSEPGSISLTSKADQEVAGMLEWGNFLNICEKEVYSRVCGMMEVSTKRYNINSVDFHDCVGRIVIGDWDGNVEVLEYA